MTFEGHGGGKATGARTSAPGAARPWALGLALALFTLFAAACTAPLPPQALGGPRTTGLHLVAPPAARETPEARPLMPLLSPDSPALQAARVVLEERARALDPLEREGVARVLARAESEYGLPVLMTLALIEQESSFDPDAVGPRGSVGLMQIKPFVGRHHAKRMGLPWREGYTLRDPVANVRIGCHYLARQMASFGSAQLALAAYNMGPARLRSRLAAGGDDTPLYVHRVLQRYHALRLRFGDPESGIGG